MSVHSELAAPSGWFAVATAAELGPRSVLARNLAGEERVLFRDEQGNPVVAGAFCPHLGAHMGHGGTVKGGQLVCPFHGFKFDGSGACVATGYGTKPPRAASVAVTPTLESGGWVFAWFHPQNEAPGWFPPRLDASGWTELRASTHPLHTHPQETTENSVDLGHFPVVHGYRDMRLHTIETEGAHLHTRYSFVRPAGFPGFGAELEVDIAVHVWGLGFSYVDVTLPKLGLTTRQFVLPVLVGPGRTELRLGTALRRGPDADWRLRLAPAWLFSGLVADLAHKTYVGDVMQDRHIWEHKTHLRQPALAEGDGPIGRYRAWSRQFYPSPPPA